MVFLDSLCAFAALRQRGCLYALPSTRNGDGGALGSAHASIIDPGDFYLAARPGHGAELEIRVGGHAGAHLRVENLRAVVAHDEIVDHVLGYRAAGLVETKTGLHRVLDRDADLDDFAALRFLRYLDS